MLRRSARLAFASLTLLATPVLAEVKASDETGFDVNGAETIAATPQAVWAVLAKPAQWWDRAHTWSGKASRLTIAPRAGGCFCEALPGGGSVEHMRVIRVEPGKMLVLGGGLGPLQAEPVAGVLTVTLTPKDGRTALSWRYVVSGLRGMKGSVIAAPVDGVLAGQFARLARHAAGRAGAAPQRR